jgi:hypothetical protein
MTWAGAQIVVPKLSEAVTEGMIASPLSCLRHEQVRLIGALVMAEEPVGQAIDDLEEIEDLLVRMRAERAAEQQGP